MKGVRIISALFLVALLNSEAMSASVIIDDPNPQAGANFGYAIAQIGDIDGDGFPDIFIGAPGANGDQGQAYLISGASGAVIRTLNSPSPQVGAQFGFSVASAGDVDGDGKNDLLVGAPGQCGSTGCTGSNGSVGRAFVFSGETGGLLRTLDHPDQTSGAFFGLAVASGGGKLIVGAPGQNVAVHVAGKVFVFNADGSLAKTINDPDGFDVDTEVGFNFGSVVASVGADILVGNAQMDMAGSVDQGRVYIFSVTGTDSTPLLTINHPEPQAGAFFGASAASAGPNILIGAPRQNVAGLTQQGRVYLFSAAGALLRTLDLPNPTLGFANFGYSVAGGDFNGDGTPDLLVGAPGQTGSFIGQGQAFVFSGVDGSLLVTLNDPTAQRDANFGFAVAFADINGDGRPDPIVGAPFQDVGTSLDQGEVFAPALSNGAVNHPPVANAGPDQTINEGSLANLNGSASSDPDGDPITFFWTQTVGPAVTLSNRSSPTPTFTAPQVSTSTLLTFQLVVNDGKVNSFPDTVNVTVVNVNQPPIANAGPDQTVNEGTLVTLNGSGSSDPDGNPLTYSWTKIAGPAVTLSNSTSATPTFTAPQVSANTLLTLQLIVSDGLLSSSDTVNITVLNVNVNQPPVANAGPDQTVNEGALVTLNGASSSDPDGNPLTFSWTQTAGPAVTLSNSNSATPTFTAPQVTTNTLLTFQLVVNDGALNSAPDTVNVTVLNLACAVDLIGTISKLTRKTSGGQDSLSFTLSVFNAGTVQNTSGFKVNFYISSDATLGTGDTLVFTKTFKDSEGRIKAGSSINLSGSVTLPSPTQGKYLIAQIDSNNNICESNEANNIATRQIP